jgi:hypothetical protein
VAFEMIDANDMRDHEFRPVPGLVKVLKPPFIEEDFLSSRGRLFR